MEHTDCFAYRATKSRYQACSALTICDCEECPFYKTFEQFQKEQAESRIRAKKKGYYTNPYYEPKGERK